MIVNLPTVDGLTSMALKLYFRAWANVRDTLIQFDRHYPDSGFFGTPDKKWDDEREYFLEAIQEDLQANLALLQQCNELALKARIAEISPYLLLVKSDISFSNAAKDIDFAMLKTLDAVELPPAVNTLTLKPLSAAYIENYGKLRVLRNQYTHLGVAGIILDPLKMLGDMVEQYLALWPERAWLEDQVDMASTGQGAFYDDKNWSPRQAVMYAFPYDRVIISNGQFKKLFGVTKAAVDYACHKCLDDWAISRHGPYASEANTAYYRSSGKVVHCLMCGGDFQVGVGPCSRPACGSKFVAPDQADFGAGGCFRCGRPAGDADDLDEIGDEASNALVTLPKV